MKNSLNSKHIHENIENKSSINSEIELRPKKCPCCGSTDIANGNEYHCKYGLEEYKVVCSGCGEILGHWAFGSWIYIRISESG